MAEPDRRDELQQLQEIDKVLSQHTSIFPRVKECARRALENVHGDCDLFEDGVRSSTIQLSVAQQRVKLAEEEKAEAEKTVGRKEEALREAEKAHLIARKSCENWRRMKAARMHQVTKFTVADLETIQSTSEMAGAAESLSKIVSQKTQWVPDEDYHLRGGNGFASPQKKNQGESSNRVVAGGVAGGVAGVGSGTDGVGSGTDGVGSGTDGVGGGTAAVKEKMTVPACSIDCFELGNGTPGRVVRMVHSIECQVNTNSTVRNREDPKRKEAGFDVTSMDDEELRDTKPDPRWPADVQTMLVLFLGMNPLMKREKIALEDPPQWTKFVFGFNGHVWKKNVGSYYTGREMGDQIRNYRRRAERFARRQIWALEFIQGMRDAPPKQYSADKFNSKCYNVFYLDEDDVPGLEEAKKSESEYFKNPDESCQHTDSSRRGETVDK